MNRSWVRFPQAALLSWVATPLTYGVASQGVLCEFSVGDVGSPCQGRGRARDQEYVACHEPGKRLEQRFTRSEERRVGKREERRGPMAVVQETAPIGSS